MIFDTDVLIWAFRRNAGAAAALDNAPDREVSAISYLELVQGVRSSRELQLLRSYLEALELRLLPLTEEIGILATDFMEEYVLSRGLGLADALIAATAAENNLPLCSGNAKHFRDLPGVRLTIFTPGLQ